MALTALNLAALPVIAGLMAGTGAMATYVVGPATAPVEVAAPKPKPCEAQTWPYIENRCVASRAEQTRKVRLVMAPRDGASDATVPEASTPVAPKMDAPPAAEKLVTRDTVGRSVEPVALQAMPEPVSRRVEKRRMREERKLARQAYRVPTEISGRRETRPVIVVRPLRLDMFR
ncbi:MAG: hypothetical protein V7608_6403 [Hyphomicrobiales bacterium]|jgi:hypothetical protein